MKDSIRQIRKSTLRSFAVSVLVIVFFAAIILLYYNMIRKEKRENIINESELTAMKAANQFDRYLSVYIDHFNLAAYLLDDIVKGKETDAEIQFFLDMQTAALRRTTIDSDTGLYGYIHGKFLNSVGYTPTEDYIPTERTWYVKAMENPGTVVLVEPYLDVFTKTSILSLSKTLSDGETVAGLDIPLDKVQDWTEETVASGTVDMEMILNETGLVVAHSNRGEVGKRYSAETGTFGAEIFRQLSTASDGFADIHYQSAHYISPPIIWSLRRRVTAVGVVSRSRMLPENLNPSISYWA